MDEKQADIEWFKAADSFKQSDGLRALNIFKNLAAHGYDVALVEIGNLYEIGKNGVPKDTEKAREYYEQAINAIDDPKAHLALGRIYYRMGKDGRSQYFHKAFKHFSYIKHEDEPGALYALGLLYSYGYGVKKNKVRAIKYYKRASKAGHILALKMYAQRLIMNGRCLLGLRLLLKSHGQIFKAVKADPGDKRLRIA